MIDYILFWISKPLADFVILLAILLIIIALYVIMSIPYYFKSMRCKHEEVRETMSCDAICRNCGMNLGFIETWREQQISKQKGETQ